MTTALETREKVELRIPVPIRKIFSRGLIKLLEKDLPVIVNETNRAIELGVETDKNAGDADSTVKQGNTAIKFVNGLRMEITRPVDEGKANLIEDTKAYLKPLVDANEKLDGMVMKRTRRIEAEQAELARAAAEKQRRLDEEAKKKEERNRNISLSKGGDGNVAPVVAEKVVTPISTSGMRSTARTRSIPNLEAIQRAVDEGVREISGVRIFQVWQFSVENAKQVPKEYRRLVRG